MSFSTRKKCGYKDCKNCCNTKKLETSCFYENDKNVIAFFQEYFPEGFSLPLIETGIYYPSSNTSLRVIKKDLFTIKSFKKDKTNVGYLNYDGYVEGNCAKIYENRICGKQYKQNCVIEKFFITLSLTAVSLDQRVQPSIRITLKRGENGEFPSDVVRSFATTISLINPNKPQSATATSIINLKPGDTLVPFFEIDTSVLEGTVFITDFTFSIHDIYKVAPTFIIPEPRPLNPDIFL